MPPKKESKDVGTLVENFVCRPFEQQVDLLSQALLREYMHKKHFHDTLKAFDDESPRDERTISSRALMAELMHISPELTQKLKSEGLEAIMELLCSVRVEKAATTQHRLAQLRASLDAEQVETAPGLSPSQIEELAALEAAIKKTKKRIKKEKRLAKEAKEAAKAEKMKSSAEAKAVSGKSRVKGHLLSMDELLDQDDSKKIQAMSEKKVRVKQEKGGGQDSETSKIDRKSAKPVSAVQESDESNSSNNSSSSSESESDDDYSAALSKIRDEARQQDRKSERWGAELPTDSPDRQETMAKGRHAVPDKPPTPVPVPATQSYDSVGPSVAEALKVALVGNDRRIPSSFWHQGFYFSTDVEYGLLQNEGGSCGVLAAIQALVVAEIFGNHRIITDDVKSNALIKAFSGIVLLAQPDVTKVVVVTSTSGNFEAKSARDQIHFISSLKRTGGFTSRASIESFLREEAIHQWVEPKGQGLLCWMLTCLLSRTIAAVQRDMDVESPLIVEHGYCSQELVNLMLCGASVSNVHDGSIQQGELVLRGFPSRLGIGFLSYMEHRRLLTVGDGGKNPHAPVWVINHESHYTTLFMKDDRRADVSKSLPSGFVSPVVFDLYFWDQLGGQDEEIRLTVTLEATPPPAAARGALVPYLNDIIRTVADWKTARVSWNGTDPLL